MVVVLCHNEGGSGRGRVCERQGKERGVGEGVAQPSLEALEGVVEEYVVREDHQRKGVLVCGEGVCGGCGERGPPEEGCASVVRVCVEGGGVCDEGVWNLGVVWIMQYPILGPSPPPPLPMAHPLPVGGQHRSLW